MKKLVRENIEKNIEVPTEIYDILLDISNMIRGVYGLDESDIEFIGYDNVSKNYSCIIHNVSFGISIDEMDIIMEHLHKEYEGLSDSISIEYLPDVEGIKVSIEV